MRRTVLAIVISLLALSSCDKTAPPAASTAKKPSGADKAAAPPQHSVPRDPNNIVSIAVASKDHSTLVAALQAAGYVDSVANPGPLTVFAPTNAAFEKLPAGTVDELLKPEKGDDLRNVLKYHVAPAVYEQKSLTDGMRLGMANGQHATISVKADGIYANDAKIVASVRASNGVVHIVDAVLLPPPR